MTRLSMDRKQYINERYIYWYKAVLEGFMNYHSIFDPYVQDVLMFEVSKDPNHAECYCVHILHKDAKKDKGKLYFRLPSNELQNNDFPILVSWAAQKLCNWEAQIKAKSKDTAGLPSEHNS